MESMTANVVQEFIAKLEREGNTKEFVDGALEGMSFAAEWLHGLAVLEINKNKYMREEWNVTTEISA